MKAKIFSSLLALSAAFSPSAHAEPITLQGEWYGETYLLVLHDLWTDIQGSWGILKFDLAWEPYDLELKGTAASLRQHLRFDPRRGTVHGFADCGEQDLQYSLQEPAIVKGMFCDQQIEKTFASMDEMKVWIREATTEEVVRVFPEPSRDSVRGFLLGLLKNAGL